MGSDSYTVTLVLADLGWVDLSLDFPHLLPDSARDNGSLADLAGQKSKSTQPRSATTSVTLQFEIDRKVRYLSV